MHRPASAAARRADRAVSAKIPYRMLLIGLLPFALLWSYWPVLVRLWSDWQTDDNYSVGQLVPLAIVVEPPWIVIQFTNIAFLGPLPCWPLEEGNSERSTFIAVLSCSPDTCLSVCYRYTSETPVRLTPGSYRCERSNRSSLNRW